MSKLSTQELFGKYCTKKEHSLQVEKLCSLIFDEVNKKVKELPETQKQILKASALLHDIGYFKTSGKEHNKYSFQIISEEGLSDFDDKDTELIAFICLYHRGKLPDKHEDKAFGILDKKKRKIVKRLCGILKIVDGFSGDDILKIDGVEINYSKDENIVEMDLKLKDKTDSIDIFKAIKKKELFEIGFKTQVILKISK